MKKGKNKFWVSPPPQKKMWWPYKFSGSKMKKNQSCSKLHETTRKDSTIVHLLYKLLVNLSKPDH